MNTTLINNWNEVVSSNDIVFILGDFCFDQKTQWVKFLKKLNGKKYLVQGNHDRDTAIPHELFEGVADIMQVYIWNHDSEELDEDGDPLKEYYDKFVLCHYCMTAWPGQWNGFRHLFGHSHSRPNSSSLDTTLIDKRPQPSYDVGVDNNNFYPIERTQINEILKDIPWSH